MSWDGIRPESFYGCGVDPPSGRPGASCQVPVEGLTESGLLQKICRFSRRAATGLRPPFTCGAMRLNLTNKVLGKRHESAKSANYLVTSRLGSEDLRSKIAPVQLAP
jgi:hypothetical protein